MDSTPAAAPVASFKVVLVGDGAVGKSTFIKRHTTATMGVEVAQLCFPTTKGPILFKVWDTSGVYEHGGRQSGYYIMGQAAMIMFDLTANKTFEDVAGWHKEVTQVIGQDAPIVLLGNKCDCENVAVPEKLAYTPEGLRKDRLQYFKTSAKSSYNVMMPFIWLARELMNDPELEFVGNK